MSVKYYSEQSISKHLAMWPSRETTVDLHNRFSRDGFIRVSDIVPDEVRNEIRGETIRLLDSDAERRDLRLKTTGGTPRAMSVVKSQAIEANSDTIRAIYNSKPLRSTLEKISGEILHSCPSDDEKFLITRQERTDDTHGWHWGDFSFALIWIIETPPVECGGMLQCVPHTIWDKASPRINHYLCTNPITTYGFKSGDLYFLRTDTTLHRTVPLTEDVTRIILNMTWAAEKDLKRVLTGDDRWWENTDVSAAVTHQR
ncbi:MAG: HalD/BesD family halogenase [Pseudonocardiaceae bacterium]